MPRMGRLEAEVMSVLWAADRSLTVREVLNSLPKQRGLAYTTVMTVLGNLHRKGLLERAQAGRAFVYRPRMTREQVSASALRDVIDAADDPRSLLLQFVRTASDEETDTIREALRGWIAPS